MLIGKEQYIDALKELLKFEGCLKEEYNHADPPFTWEETKQAISKAIDMFNDDCTLAVARMESRIKELEAIIILTEHLKRSGR